MSGELDICRRLFAELETQRTETLAELNAWSPHCVSFRLASDSWCAIEVLDHIVRAETGTIDGVRIGLQSPHILGAEDRPGVAALNRALRSEQCFKVPAGAEAVYPDAQTTLSQVANRWEQKRAELGRLLRELEPGGTRYGLAYHPFAGWMTFAEVLDYFSAHLYHHGFQLARLRVGSAHLDSTL